MSSHEHDAWFSCETEKLGPTLFRVAFAILRISAPPLSRPFAVLASSDDIGVDKVTLE